jgi:hypothetical protein
VRVRCSHCSLWSSFTDGARVLFVCSLLFGGGGLVCADTRSPSVQRTFTRQRNRTKGWTSASTNSLRVSGPRCVGYEFAPLGHHTCNRDAGEKAKVGPEWGCCVDRLPRVPAPTECADIRRHGPRDEAKGRLLCLACFQQPRREPSRFHTGPVEPSGWIRSRESAEAVGHLLCWSGRRVL